MVRAIESINGTRGFLVIVHLDKAEAARAAGFAIGDHCHRVDLPDGRKEIPEIRLGGAPGEVADIDLLHLVLSLTARGLLPGVTWSRDQTSKPQLPELTKRGAGHATV